MLSGFYTAASGMLIQQRKLNVLTNNIANAKTTGYKAERVVTETFDHELLTRIERGNTEVIGAGSPIRIVRDVPVNFDPSALEGTDRPFDMAINGQGYFSVLQAATTDEQGAETAPEQTLLTRDGNFDIDNEGYLTLPGVGRVLGEKGPLKVGGSYFTVTEDGQVFDAKGKRLDKIRVSVPNDGVPMEKVANGLYSVADMGTNTTLVPTNVLQGVLEKNNVDINREYTLVMEAQRAFQSCSQALKIVDSMNQKSASQIAAL